MNKSQSLLLKATQPRGEHYKQHILESIDRISGISRVLMCPGQVFDLLPPEMAAAAKGFVHEYLDEYLRSCTSVHVAPVVPDSIQIELSSGWREIEIEFVDPGSIETLLWEKLTLNGHSKLITSFVAEMSLKDRAQVRRQLNWLIGRTEL